MMVGDDVMGGYSSKGFVCLARRWVFKLRSRDLTLEVITACPALNVFFFNIPDVMSKKCARFFSSGRRKKSCP